MNVRTFADNVGASDEERPRITGLVGEFRVGALRPHLDFSTPPLAVDCILGICRPPLPGREGGGGTSLETRSEERLK